MKQLNKKTIQKIESKLKQLNRKITDECERVMLNTVEEYWSELPSDVKKLFGFTTVEKYKIWLMKNHRLTNDYQILNISKSKLVLDDFLDELVIDYGFFINEKFNLKLDEFTAVGPLTVRYDQEMKIKTIYFASLNEALTKGGDCIFDVYTFYPRGE